MSKDYGHRYWVLYRYWVLWDRSVHQSTLRLDNRRSDTCDPCFEGGACQKVLLKSKQRVFA